MLKFKDPQMFFALGINEGIKTQNQMMTVHSYTPKHMHSLHIPPGLSPWVVEDPCDGKG